MARRSDLQIVLLTPPGRGAIAVLRVEGARALATVEKNFQPQGGPPLGDRPLDRLVVGRFGPEPGEQVVVRRLSGEAIEICAHGGHAAVARIVDLLALGQDCVTAWQEWLAGQEDDPIRVAAAIALADAPTLRTAAILLDQYHGALRRAIQQTQAALQSGDLLTAGRLVADMLSRADIGLHLVRPWRVVLAGPPNVGKSTLLNALLGYGRAITHTQPGTTRDVVTATTAVDGWPIELADTAGLRATIDPLEQAGIALTRQQLAAADLAILVFDVSEPWTPDLDRLAHDWPAALVVFNKSDLVFAAEGGKPHHFSTGAAKGNGVQELIAAISKRLVPLQPSQGVSLPFTSHHATQLTYISDAIAQNDARAAESGLALL